ncbi:MAG TPA: hypothetical protein VK780_05075 [Thermoanaerobaculia bacterium]|nr:hypothetical protein [Thermoanaerobaculia bacterium]
MGPFDLCEFAPDGRGCPSGRQDAREIRGRRGASGALERVEKRADLLDARERKPAMVDSEARDLGGLFDRAPDRGFVERRKDVLNRGLARRRPGEERNQLEDDVELESFSIDDALRRDVVS